MKRFCLVLGGMALSVVLTTPAFAHVTIQPDEAPTGEFFRFVVRVPNEREETDTTKVKVDFPDNLIFVSFQPKAGWKHEVTMKKLDEPIEAFGAKIDEVVDTVTWSGGSIAPNQFDEFGFSAKVPDDPSELEFAAFQTYSSGEIVEWTGPPDSEEPAALVNVVGLDLEEGEGELSALADLQDQIGGMDHAAMMTTDDGNGNLGVILGGVGTGLGAVALLVALTRKRV